MFHTKVTLPESHPDYPSITQTQCANWRVIRCPDDLQWIVRYTAHLSGGIKATIENGGLWNSGMATNP